MFSKDFSQFGPACGEKPEANHAIPGGSGDASSRQHKRKVQQRHCARRSCYMPNRPLKGLPTAQTLQRSSMFSGVFLQWDRPRPTKPPRIHHTNTAQLARTTRADAAACVAGHALRVAHGRAGAALSPAIGLRFAISRHPPAAFPTATGQQAPGPDAELEVSRIGLHKVPPFCWALVQGLGC